LNHVRSHVVAYLALFVALSGTALAAAPFLRGDGNAAGSTLDLAPVPNPSPTPDIEGDASWHTLMSIPGVGDVQVACARWTDPNFEGNVYEFARLINRSGGVILDPTAPATRPGRTDLFTGTNGRDIRLSLQLHALHSRQVVTLDLTGMESVDSTGVPTNPEGCHFFGQYLSVSTDG
jgi:hypothetical protein